MVFSELKKRIEGEDTLDSKIRKLLEHLEAEIKNEQQNKL